MASSLAAAPAQATLLTAAGRVRHTRVLDEDLAFFARRLSDVQGSNRIPLWLSPTVFMHRRRRFR
jgi:hypothetical protein